MQKRLLQFIARPTSKYVIINTLGNYLTVFFSAFFVYLLVRVLSPSEYGVFSVLFGVAYVLTPVLEFGTTATLYSSLPPLIQNRDPLRYRLVKSIFVYQSILAVIIIILLCAVFPILDRHFLKTNAPLWELYVVAVSVLFFIWQNFLSNCLIAAKKVLEVNIYANAANILKTILIFVLWILGYLSVGSLFVTFGIIGPLLFYFFVYWFHSNHLKHFFSIQTSREDIKATYTLTYFIATQFNNFGMRMDLFILSYFRPKDEVGFYGLAQKIILTVIATIVSITQVISPAFSSIQSKKDIFSHIKSGVLYMLVPTGLFFVLAVLPNGVFFLFFPDTFQPAFEITRRLAFAFILLPFMSLITLFVLYTVKKPVYILAVNILFFCIISTGSFLFIPKYGYMAPIVSIFTAFSVASVLLTIISYSEYRKMK